MRKAVLFAKRTNKWELLSANLKPHLMEMPHLQDIVTSLDGVITEGKELDLVVAAGCRSLTTEKGRRPPSPRPPPSRLQVAAAEAAR